MSEGSSYSAFPRGEREGGEPERKEGEKGVAFAAPQEMCTTKNPTKLYHYGHSHPSSCRSYSRRWLRSD